MIAAVASITMYAGVAKQIELLRAELAELAVSAEGRRAPNPQNVRILLGGDETVLKQEPRFAKLRVDRGCYAAGAAVGVAKHDVHVRLLGLLAEVGPEVSLADADGSQTEQKYPSAGGHRPGLRAFCRGYKLLMQSLSSRHVFTNILHLHAEIADYAQWLGLDLETEQELVWICRDGLKAKLPSDWKAL